MRGHRSAGSQGGCARDVPSMPRRWDPDCSAGTGEPGVKPMFTDAGAELAACRLYTNDHHYVNSTLLIVSRKRRIVR